MPGRIDRCPECDSAARSQFLVSGFWFRVVSVPATTNQETSKPSAEFHITCGDQREKRT
jgi:hypothetical protein